MIVDTHAHIIVPVLTQAEGDGPARVSWEGGRQVIEHAGRRITSAVREIVRIEEILQEEKAAGVDHVLLSPWVPLLGYTEAADAVHFHRQNEALAALAQRFPERVSVLGTVPLQDPERAARDLELLMEVPGMRGVEVTASVGGIYLGDDRFRPFWAAAEAVGAFVFVHPTTRGLDASAFDAYYLWNAVGNPLETTIAAAHMVMAGVMEAHPRLTVLLAHAGGAVLALRGRLDHAHDVVAPARARLRESPEASLRRFYFDAITHDPRLLRDLIAYAGPDHVLLGSDYPFDMGLDRPVEQVRALELPAEDEALILGGNARRLMGL